LVYLEEEALLQQELRLFVRKTQTLKVRLKN
jgi:hypothetical protein